MIEYGLFLIFWYGLMHAFAPDHMTAIVNFSIGKQKAKVMMITLGFALGHGVSLYLFSLLLSDLEIPEQVLAYGDVLASLVLILMGMYLLYLVAANQIHIRKHEHHGIEHAHIWFGHEHHHQNANRKWLSGSAMMGVLMGIGGVRGMLVTLSAVSNDQVSGLMILSFTLGVTLVFAVFGLTIAVFNQKFLQSKKPLRRAVFGAGLISCLVGGQAFL
ncbi:urease accessory protein UreH [Hydrogenovibrio crunogenus]|uniref:Urease accessory protein UreH n=1 Tax=Hydrogenovibrio crunogenus TaxID=39765 RepID=A0A4P7NXK3_9GAMM|nr:hypothetical protein [Hydrogenovibrio crunogenus]QBZ82457.1 urease accessory protein UreH [Hydrogenovibrio crunogenus]